MSDAAEQVDEVVDPPKPDEPVEQTIEEIAAEQGHKSREDHIASGGDPKKWRNAEVWLARGELMEQHKTWTAEMKEQYDSRMDEMESGFNTRLDNVNKLHKAELVRKRDAAIDLADRETANNIQTDIDNLDTQPVNAGASADQAALDAWNTANPWINGAEPKAAYAKQQFNAYQQQGLTVKQSIANAEADVGRAFPEVNPNRDTHPTPEGGSRPGKKRGARKLTMADITTEERKWRQAMPDAWKTEAEFLQAVQDSRSES